MNITKANTKLFALPGGWVKAIYDTGQVDAEDRPITIEATTSRSALEVSEGITLPKAQLKAVLAELLGKMAQPTEVELDIL